MRTAYFSSLLFALLSSLCLTATTATAAVQAPDSVSVPVAEQAAKVNLNAADAATLQRELSGVGETKAKAIISHRENHGPFASVDELLEVKGIGNAILESNRDKLEAN